MKMLRYGFWSTVILAGWCAAAWSQTAGTDRVTVPFSDPSRPGTLKVSMQSGGITVKGYNGKEAIVEAKVREEERSPERTRAEAGGLRRIANTATGLTIEEENNVISVWSQRDVDITVQVPTHTSLKLSAINDGEITVELVQGEIEVTNVNDNVTLKQVSGSVVAHASNGDLKVALVSVTPGKPMSFTSMNGDVDVTLPADTKANITMRSDQGEIFTDFDVRMDQAQAKPVAEGAAGKGSKYRVRVDQTLRGTINGGGPEIQFRTFNGDIFIRKLK